MRHSSVLIAAILITLVGSAPVLAADRVADAIARASRNLQSERFSMQASDGYYVLYRHATREGWRGQFGVTVGRIDAGWALGVRFDIKRR